MPRPFTTDERNLVKASHVTHVCRAEVMDLNETWMDLADIVAGVDPFVGAQISVGVDSRAYAATVRVTRGLGASSLSPLVEASDFNKDASDAYFPRLNGGTRIRLYTYTLDPDDDPSEDTVKLAFDGRIDDPDFSDEVMVLACRDLGGKLLDTIITEDRTYEDEAGIPAADVAQQLVTDNADILGEAITLSVPEDPEYLVTKFQQVLVSVMDALNNLATLFGWVVRYEFNEDTDAFELTLFDPHREKTTPDYTLEATEYLAVEQAKLDTTMVRNHVRVWYTDGVTGEPLYQEAIDSGSVAAFGRRFMQLGGEQLRGITNGNDALALAQYALSDLSTPLFDHTVKSTYTWFARIGDLVGFTQNGVHYDEDQALALVGILHEFPDAGQGAATTTFQCRGKPAGAYERWLRLQGGPIFPQIPPAPELLFLLGEATQFGGTSATVDGAIWLGYRMPKGVDEIRVHVLLGDGPDLPVPDIDNTTLALTIRRPEGDIGSITVHHENRYPGELGEYASMALLSTRPGMWKRVIVYGVRGGLTSKPVMPAVTQAVDPDVMPLEGTIASLTVVRSGSTNTVTVTPGTLETDPTKNGNWVFIVRNNHILPGMYIRDSTDPVVFPDSGLEPSAAATYVYDAFIWNGGVSGPKYRTTASPPSLTPPEWADGTPRAVVHENVPKIQLSWTATTPGASGVRVEASIDRVNVRVVGSGDLASGTVYDTDTSAKLYRLAAVNIVGVRLAVTPWKWSTALPPTISNPNAVPQFMNGTPKAILTGDFFSPRVALAISWRCATPGAKEIWIQESDDSGVSDPWSLVGDPTARFATVAEGTWLSRTAAPVEEQKFYRLVAVDAAGATLATSAPVEYIP